MNNMKLFASMEVFYKITRLILGLKEDETNLNTYYNIQKTVRTDISKVEGFDLAP